MDTPDLPTNLNPTTVRKLYDRKFFRVGERLFVRLGPGKYADGKITVYCDQQDSTSWLARVGAVCTGYYWTPEAAVKKLLGAVEAL
jgi:hypothetical protein